MKLRESILGKNDKKLIPFLVPEWNETVFLRTLSARERYSLLGFADKKEQLSARLVITSCCDSDGNKLFTDQDLDVLLDKAGSAIEGIALAAIEHNGLSGASIKEAKKN